jgi:hypothetical protein
MPECQKIDFHEVKDPNGNHIAEKGFYNKKTGELVMGVRFVPGVSI